ncbi:hypothetical protein, partial [Mycobacterium sp.]|uniref:hypothetical protein n=1 Tax=Mycobacterium sp. TaxID=1785 RepID=UPI003F99ABA4
VRPVKVAGAPLLEVVYRRRVHPSLILTRNDIDAGIGSQLHHPHHIEGFPDELYGRACINRKNACC